MGCGTGDLTHALAPSARRVTAIDPSRAMLAYARRATPTANVTWIEGVIEEAPLAPPYDLVVAGESLHWTDWEVTLPHLAHALAPDGAMAVVSRTTAATPWQAELDALIATHSTNRDYRPTDLIAELGERGLFASDGTWQSADAPFAQPVGSYVASFHSRNGFSRERMGEPSADAFDRALTALLAAHDVRETVTLAVGARLVWGWPLAR